MLHTLCDVVSKNGNLMVSVPMRGDGTIDDKAEKIVEDIAAWMAEFGEAIYGTRPWRRNGEGPTTGNTGLFSEGGPVSPYGARDIRYVTKGSNLHAFILGWPDDNVARLTLLAGKDPTLRGTVERITLPGSTEPLRFTRTTDALEVALPPAARNAIGLALILSGDNVAV